MSAWVMSRAYPVLSPCRLSADSRRYARALSSSTPFDAKLNLRNAVDRLRRTPPPPSAAPSERDWAHAVEAIGAACHVILHRVDTEKIGVLAAAAQRALQAR